MSAPIGNQFWKLRSSHGRKPIFKNPKQLEDACMEYFEVTSEEIIKEQNWVGKDGDEVTKNHPVPFTLSGLQIFLDIGKDAWISYREKKGFSEVCTRVEEIIYTQKFKYAATGFFNANIIARDLGLADKKDFSVEMQQKKTTKDLFPDIDED